MKNLSNWRSVRLWESSVQKELRSRHTMWLHGLCIGTLVLAVMWATSHLQMVFGSDSLALRYLLTLGAGYLFYLLLLRFWAASLLRRESSSPLDGLNDLPLPDIGSGPQFGGGGGIQSGGGGDFGGGGASGDFSAAGDTGSALGDIAGGALEVAAGADEGAVVAVPVVAIFLIGCALLFGAGSLLLLYFGWEALLTVAVEVAFSYVSARTAIRVVREGWLSAAIRLTWKPLLGALFCAVLLGATLDYFIPSAHSLPHAFKLIRHSRAP
jgi:hypothetical protein